jgi:hypothetical protein
MRLGYPLKRRPNPKIASPPPGSLGVQLGQSRREAEVVGVRAVRVDDGAAADLGRC